MGRGKKIILGIDIGGSKIRATIGHKSWEFDIPKGKKKFIKILKKFPKADEVEIGVAGVIEGTKVKKSPNIKYLKNFDFKKIFLNTRLKVDNDARSFLRARLVRHRVSNRVLGITIGTGIGRAYAEKGKVLKIKFLEYPEKWEREYQKIRDRKNDIELAEYLAGKINLIIKKYKTDVVILGGGVLGRKRFYARFKKLIKAKTHV